MLPVLYLSLVSFVQATTEISDGETIFINSRTDPDTLFLYRGGENHSSSELILAVTLYSATETFAICGNVGRFRPDCGYTGSGITPAIIIPADDIDVGKDVYTMVRCGYCRFRLTATRSIPVTLKLNTPIFGLVSVNRTERFDYKHRGTGAFHFYVKGKSDAVRMRVESKGEGIDCSSVWDGGRICRFPGNLQGREFHLFVAGKEGAQFLIAAFSLDGTVELQSRVQLSGTLQNTEVAKYSYYLLTAKSVFTVSLTQYSGDVDITVSTTSDCTVPYISSEREGNDLISLTKTDRELAFNRTYGWFYVCLTSITDATYSLSVEDNRSETKLLQFDTLEKSVSKLNQFVYYQIPLGTIEDVNITIAVTVLTGNPDLYVKLCFQQSCTYRAEEVHYPADCKSYVDNVQYSANEEGNEVVEIRHESLLCKKECHYTVGVLGRSQDSSYFLILARTSETRFHILTSKVPYLAKNPRSGTLYFQYTVTSASIETLEFQVSPHIGNPDLYCSRLVQYPTPDTAEFSSQSLGSATESILFQAGETQLIGEYYLAVVSAEPSSFSVEVFESSEVHFDSYELLPGILSTRLIGQGKTEKFVFHVSVEETEGKPHIRVGVLPYADNVSVCIFHSKSILEPGSCLWEIHCEANFVFECVLRIEPEDRHYLSSGRYSVLVTSRSSINDGRWVRIWFEANQHIQLQLSQIFLDVVEMGQINYYLISLMFPLTSYRISQTIVSGDVDLYVSYDPTNKLPGPQRSNKCSQTVFEELLFISETDLLPYCYDKSKSCVLYIGVSGVTRSAFTLQIKALKKIIYDDIMDGQSKMEDRLEGDNVLIRFVVQGEKDVYSTVQMMDGKVEMMAELCAHRFTNEIGAVQRLPVLNETIASPMAHQLHISSVDIHSFCSNLQCILNLNLNCQSQLCWYQLSTTQSHFLMLSANVPITDFVHESEIKYYELFCAYSASRIQVSLSINSGSSDADLGLSKGTSVSKPGEFQWKSERKGDDFLEITQVDVPNAVSGLLGYYVIGVFGRTDCDYTLLVNIDSSSVLPLSATTSRKLFLRPGASVFLYYPHRFHRGLKFSLSPRYGSPKMFVKSYRDSIPVSANYPSPSDHHWEGVYLAGSSMLRIDVTEDKYCYLCTYIVGVVNEGNTGSEFRLSEVGDNLGSLYPFSPVFGMAAKHAIDEYSLIGCRKGCEVAVAAYYGDVNLYVNLGSRVTPWDYRWKSTTLGGVEFLILDGPIEAAIYIGVYAQSDSRYLLEVSIPNEIIPANAVVGGTYSLRYSNSSAKFFYVAENCSFRATALTADFSFLVLDYRSLPDSSELVASYTFGSPSGDSFLRQIEANTEKDGRTHVISVQGEGREGHDLYELGLFSFIAFKQGTPIVLGVTSEDFAGLSLERPKTEYIIHSMGRGTLRILLEVCSGNAQLAVFSLYQNDEIREENVLEIRSDIFEVYVDLTKVSSVLLKISAEFNNGNPAKVMYSLSSRVVENFRFLVPGGDGRIRVYYREKLTIHISWEPLLTQGTHLPMDPEHNRYRVYETCDRTQNIETTCGIHLGEQRGIVRVACPGDRVQTECEARVQSGCRVNVLALDIAPSSRAVPFYYPYIPVDIPYIEAEETHFTWLAAFLIAVLILLILALVYLKRPRLRPIPHLADQEMSSLKSLS